MSTHYSFAQEPKKLNKWANSVCKQILELGITYPLLCYTGMSGISAATALMLKLNQKGVKVQMCYVRKEHEKSHGTSVEQTVGAYNSFTKIFVDDFIAMGNTFNKVQDIVGDIKYLALQQDKGNDFRLPNKTFIYGE